MYHTYVVVNKLEYGNNPQIKDPNNQPKNNNHNDVFCKNNPTIDIYLRDLTLIV